MKSKTKSEEANFSDISGRKISPQQSDIGKEKNEGLCPQYMSGTRDEVICRSFGTGPGTGPGATLPF